MIGGDLFIISDTIGSGSEGSVYLAKRDHDNTPVAIKVVDQAGNSGVRARVESLIRYAAQSPPPPGVCVPLQVAERASSRTRYALIILPLYKSLSYLAEVRASTPRFSDLIRIAGETAEAFAWVEAGGVHGDYSVRNIPFWSDAGRYRPVILDLDSWTSARDHVEPPSIAGTPPFIPPNLFISPDQDRGRPYRDRWAGAVYLYMLLTGTHPFAGAKHWPMEDADDDDHQRILQGPWTLHPTDTSNRPAPGQYARIIGLMHACGPRFFQLWHTTFTAGMEPHKRPQLAAYAREFARLHGRLMPLPDGSTAVLEVAKPGMLGRPVVVHGFVQMETGWITQIVPGPIDMRHGQSHLPGTVIDDAGSLVVTLMQDTEITSPVRTSVRAGSRIPVIPGLMLTAHRMAWMICPLVVRAIL